MLFARSVVTSEMSLQTGLLHHQRAAVESHKQETSNGDYGLNGGSRGKIDTAVGWLIYSQPY